MKRAAIYCRVSTEDQEEKGGSLADQEKSCREYAAQHGYTVVESLVMREQHTGSQLSERPKLGVIRDAMKRGEIEALIFLKIDRLTREPLHWQMLMIEAMDAGVTLASVLEPISQTTLGEITSTLLAGFGKLEREAIRDRMWRGKRQRAQSGKVLNSGVDLYGYRREAGHYVIREDEAAVIRSIYQWCAEGESISRISARLLREGIPAPGQRSGMGVGRWGDSTLSRILHDTRYRGEGYAFATISVMVPGVGKRNRPAPEDHRIKLPAEAVPAIVSEELWDEVQARLAKAAPVRTARQERTPKLLRGYVKCAVCGGTMTPQGIGRGGKRYYRCTSYMRPGERCGGKMPREEKLDAWVWEELHEIVTNPANVLAMLAEVGADERDTSAGLVKERDAAKAALAKLDGQAAKLVELLMGDDDALPLDVVKAKLAGIETQRKAASARVDAAEKALEAGKRRTADGVGFMAMLDRVKANVRHADFALKREIVEALVERVVAGKPGEDWRIELAIPLAVDGKPSQKHWGTGRQPPVISAAIVSSLAHPDFLVEIEAVAIVRA